MNTVTKFIFVNLTVKNLLPIVSGYKRIRINQGDKTKYGSKSTGKQAPNNINIILPVNLKFKQ